MNILKFYETRRNLAIGSSGNYFIMRVRNTIEKFGFFTTTQGWIVFRNVAHACCLAPPVDERCATSQIKTASISYVFKCATLHAAKLEITKLIQKVVQPASCLSYSLRTLCLSRNMLLPGVLVFVSWFSVAFVGVGFLYFLIISTNADRSHLNPF